MTTMKAIRTLCAIGLLGMASHALAAPPGGFAGSWVNDNIRSSWSDGNFPTGKMSLRIQVTFSQDHMIYHSVNDTAKGKPPMVIDFDAVMDGKPYPLTGSARYDTVRVRRLGDDQIELLELKGGDVIVGAIWQLKDNGKTLMRWGIGKSPEGKSKSYQEFFSRG
ncbi:hypothetical protein [Gluconacetobacter sacchari]|uniref:Uncharacterized protein n=2 Tax=Gluconacetobacter sacchari TaxID=92759 RepID=A0A7W4NSS6_9PROT|nr:hypothetical protein [Gluconacetobacter sacchari]MBB2162388.1 hypothetical protein [Gluconacetobacter sacchari]